MFNLFSRAPSKDQFSSSGIPFRIVFVSPFFELEVHSGSKWEAVHSQVESPYSTADTAVYPLLRFTSFASAVEYAKTVLGLSIMKKPGLFTSPPASFMSNSESKVVSKVLLEKRTNIGMLTVPPPRRSSDNSAGPAGLSGPLAFQVYQAPNPLPTIHGEDKLSDGNTVGKMSNMMVS